MCATYRAGDVPARVRQLKERLTASEFERARNEDENFVLVVIAGMEEGYDTVVKLINERYAPGQRRKITELEWPAMLRMLDRRDPSFRD